MSIIRAAAVAAVALLAAAPANAATLYTFAFTASGSGQTISFGNPDSVYDAGTLVMSVFIEDGANAGTSGQNGVGYAAGATQAGISFSSGAPIPSFDRDTVSRGLACFANPSATLPVGIITVDPSCGSFNYRSFTGRSTTTFAGTITGLTITRGGTDTGLRFAPGVPEPTTWALMLAGFGMVGYTMRRRRPQVVFA